MKNIIIVAGGTGGHINAAISLGEHFKSEYKVNYISADRHLDYKLFKNYNVSHFTGKALRQRNPFILLKNCILKQQPTLVHPLQIITLFCAIYTKSFNLIIVSLLPMRNKFFYPKRNEVKCRLFLLCSFVHLFITL